MIVTAIDAAFLPGLKALVNSIRIHSPGMPVACFTYGPDCEEVVDLVDVVVHDQPIAPFLPPGEGTDENCHPMYARILAPKMFGRCIWMDADQIVQTDMQPLLDMGFGAPVAAVRATYNTQRSVNGIKTHNAPGIFSGLMVFNAEEWNKRKLTEKCLEIMQDKDAVFRFVVQSVLNIVLEGDFHELSPVWQGFANRKTTNPKNFRVLHWHGRERKPWTHPGMPNADAWKEYA